MEIFALMTSILHHMLFLAIFVWALTDEMLFSVKRMCT